MAIKTLDEFLATIPDDDNRERMVDVVVWVGFTYPELELRIAWNQAMFIHRGTYIIGFSAASKHMAVAPERATMIRFEPVMRERGTDFEKRVAHQPWDKPFDYELLDASSSTNLPRSRMSPRSGAPKSTNSQPPRPSHPARGHLSFASTPRTTRNGSVPTVLPALEHYLAHPESAHTLEEFDALIKQTVHDYEEHPDEVSTLDEVKAELGLD